MTDQIEFKRVNICPDSPDYPLWAYESPTGQYRDAVVKLRITADRNGKGASWTLRALIGEFTARYTIISHHSTLREATEYATERYGLGLTIAQQIAQALAEYPYATTYQIVTALENARDSVRDGYEFMETFSATLESNQHDDSLELEKASMTWRITHVNQYHS